uniref:Protein XRI1 n=1 Tax=Cajanus cajan TaxID=3821 RepID=A0A151QP27_CAJCA|nr:Protein XRI1 [Cajanus cajan]
MLNGAREPWDWHREDYYLQKSFNYAEISQGLWNEAPQNEDLSYVFNDETTPVKACGDFAYNDNNSESNNMEKEPDKCLKTSYQIKRRRMLQFNTQDGEHSPSNENLCSAYLKVKGKEDSNEDVFSELPQWIPGASGSASASSYEELESAEGWLADCFKDTEMQLCPEDLNFSGADDVHIDVAELCNFPPACEQNVIQHRITRTPKNIVVRGGKSFIETPSKLISSVAYPFAFIKPSDAHGDVTLKEINQRILSPSPMKSKQSVEDPSSYPKSAFSGKPVVGKTKVHIEGGKGSITIMRTKG